MNARLSEPSPLMRMPEDAGFDELMQVGFVPIAAVLTAKILIGHVKLETCIRQGNCRVII
ncbi:hypothetical protein H6G89_08345 [Oscillatoria sp. FACHB-1407]|uniref:hypothetical protein n=1 Tax=Oscillatoria sp. FACHB-1407 TaxID=2692847 RepID=UPI0016840E6C|nr:hypothetical protein [Oscillatoria sp. FACHB-1407]MBD2461050.1 hypothetical protein [Oscillatoria sp. FACHB-1407]